MVNKYCSRCKDRGGPFVKYAKSEKKQYYYCRPCNAGKMARRRETPEGKEQALEQNRRQYRVAREKVLARQALARAVRSGRVHKPARCQRCNTEATVAAHHEDYKKRLDVSWLCSGCHADRHRILLANEESKNKDESMQMQ